MLGGAAEGTVYFGVAGPLARAEGGAARPAGARPVSLREAGPHLSDRDVGLMTHAVGLANWHAVHRHCPRCGAVTAPEQAGHSRRCPVDGSEHFPRLDPAVIMLVTDPDDRCLLARNAQWPERRGSVLAGFVEPREAARQGGARAGNEEDRGLVSTFTHAGGPPWPEARHPMLRVRAGAAT